MEKSAAKVGQKVRLSGMERIGVITKIKGQKAKVGVVGESSQWRKIADLIKETD